MSNKANKVNKANETKSPLIKNYNNIAMPHLSTVIIPKHITYNNYIVYGIFNDDVLFMYGTKDESVKSVYETATLNNKIKVDYIAVVPAVEIGNADTYYSYANLLIKKYREFIEKNMTKAAKKAMDETDEKFSLKDTDTNRFINTYNKNIEDIKQTAVCAVVEYLKTKKITDNAHINYKRMYKYVFNAISRFEIENRAFSMNEVPCDKIFTNPFSTHENKKDFSDAVVVNAVKSVLDNATESQRTYFFEYFYNKADVALIAETYAVAIPTVTLSLNKSKYNFLSVILSDADTLNRINFSKMDILSEFVYYGKQARIAPNTIINKIKELCSDDEIVELKSVVSAMDDKHADIINKILENM